MAAEGLGPFQRHIGGFSLGLERTGGFKTVAFCEIDPFCRAVLAKHWPGVPCYADVTKLCRRIYDCDPENEDGEVNCPRCGVEFGECECIGTDQFIDEHGIPDIITAGFPCQDISLIGEGAGIFGERSGLYGQALRITGELRPQVLIMENIDALVRRGLGEVLGGLADIGYDAEWAVIPANGIRALHRRKRIWIVAYPRGEGLEGHTGHGEVEGQKVTARPATPAYLPRRIDPATWWEGECGIRRVADGVPSWVDRIKCLGNSVVPQVVEIIGQAILAKSAKAKRK